MDSSKKKWYKTKWFISTCAGVAFAGTIGLTVGLCYNAWYTTYNVNSDASGKLKVEFESTTNNKTGQAIADSDGTKSITMTKNPHDPDTDHTNDLTNIQLHGLITNRPNGMWYPIYCLDDKGQTLVNNGYLDTSSVPTDTDHPLFNIVLKKDIQNSDSTIPHEFDVSLTMDNKSITKHIVLTGWTEWQNMPTGGITTSGATTLKTPSDTLVITTHLLNQIGDISWDIKNGSGTDFSTQFNISDNLDGSYNFNLKAPWVSASVDVFFMCKNNDLDSNTITITLSQ